MNPSKGGKKTIEDTLLTDKPSKRTQSMKRPGTKR